MIHRNIAPNMIAIMKFITFLGSATFYIILSTIIIIYFIKKKYYIDIWILILSNLGTYGLNEIVKHIFKRIRPIKYFLIEQSGYSFPSGHAMVSFVFYTTITYMFLTRNKNKSKKLFIWILNFLVVLLIGFSRIYLGVHWPTDVVGGYILGIVFFSIVKKLYKLLSKKYI